jgi:hypothetical protein
MQLCINPSLCFPLPIIPFLLILANPSFYLLGELAFLACGANTHPLVPGLLSTVLPLLLYPPQGTPQINLRIYRDDINNISRLV